MSMDFTYVLELSQASTRTPACWGAANDGSFSGSSSPQAGRRMRPICQLKAQSAQCRIRSAPSPVPGAGGILRDEIRARSACAAVSPRR